MLLTALALLAGTVCLLVTEPLPTTIYLKIVCVLLMLALVLVPTRRRRLIKYIFAFLIGLIWAGHSVQVYKAQQLPAAFLTAPVRAIGIVDSIPARREQQITFVLKITRLTAPKMFSTRVRRVRLTWYFSPSTLQVGDEWQLTLRLKTPTSNHVPGTFNYARWLIAQQLVATGYVQASAANRLILRHYPLKLVDSLRATIAAQIQASLRTTAYSGLIQALAVGVRDAITPAQWDVLRGTGTNHLFAIAGLHIGFISTFIYALLGFAWRRLGSLPLRCPTPLIAASGALLSAIIYSALAGFSLPTQRAVIMTAVLLLSTLARKKIPVWHCWSLALMLVVLNEPLAVLSASFWMSFSAVALIIYGVSGRSQPQSRIQHWLYPQWVIALGLMPISLLFFQECSLLNFIANVIAIPWIGFLVLPLSLLGGLLSLGWPVGSNYLLLSAAKLLGLLWPLLVKFTQFTALQWQHPITHAGPFITALIGIMLLLAPRGMPARWLGLIWVLPLVLSRPALPPAGSVWLSILGTKTGMAVIAQTHTQTLLYESHANPALNSNSVLPYLHYLGVHQLARLILNTSLATQQAALALLDTMPVQHVLLNNATPVVQGSVLTCTTAQRWQGDGVDFSVINLQPAQNKPPVCALLLTLDNKTALIVDSAQLTLNSAALVPIRISTLISTYHLKQSSLLRLIKSLQPAQLIITNALTTQAQTLLSRQLEHGKIIASEQGSLLTLHLQNQEI